MNKQGLKWGVVIISLLVAGYGLLPTVLDWSDGELDRNVEGVDSEMVDWVMKNGKPLTLGLDLQGGLLLQYKVLVERALQDKLDQYARDIEARLEEREKGVDVEATNPGDGYKLFVEFGNASNTELVNDDFMTYYTNLERKKVGSNKLQLTMPEDYLQETRKLVIQQAVQTIRQRVNALGVTEPSITRKGQTDIVVQLPGLKDDDVERAKELIGQTAQLRFRMVDDEGTNDFFEQFKGNLPDGFNLRRISGGEFLSVTHKSKEKLEEFFKGKVDNDHIIGYERQLIKNQNGEIDEEASYWKSYYIFAETKLQGQRVQDARVRTGQKFNKPYVSLNFDTKGGEIFAELSKNNVGKRMAVMLDDKVRSAPVFEEAILGGRARITMGTMRGYEALQKEARDLVIVLRNGALPAPIEMQYETVVGPTLGEASIEASTRALMVGSILVILFMMFYYRGSGVISVIALLLNFLFIMSALAALGATLTLPGIAGIILTVGMAVDANVIIFERMREEIRAGRTPREAVEAGYDKGVTAVLDANITTGIAALVLMQYGTGPIRGFAITLLIGIIFTLFTAVFISKLLFDQWLQTAKPSDLSI